ITTAVAPTRRRCLTSARIRLGTGTATVAVVSAAIVKAARPSTTTRALAPRFSRTAFALRTTTVPRQAPVAKTQRTRTARRPAGMVRGLARADISGNLNPGGGPVGSAVGYGLGVDVTTGASGATYGVTVTVKVVVSVCGGLPTDCTIVMRCGPTPVNVCA